MCREDFSISDRYLTDRTGYESEDKETKDSGRFEMWEFRNFIIRICSEES
jgi:hypothetical protein